MKQLLIALSLSLLAACAAPSPDSPDEREDVELEGIHQAVAEACPAHISASLNVPWGFYYGATDTWNLSSGWNLSDPWCPYYNADATLYLFHSIPAGGDCAQFGATSWWCWGAGGGGAYALSCPSGMTVKKPDAYKPTSASAWRTPWRSDWTTYESSLPAFSASSSLKEPAAGGLRIRCDYPVGGQWLWFSR